MMVQQQKIETDATKAALAWRTSLLNFRDQQGRTTLHLAAVEDSAAAAQMCQLLLDLGADAAQTCGVAGAPVLHYSVTTGNANSCSVVTVLLEAGASALTPYEDISALEMAAGAAAAMVNANDSGDGTEQTQSTMEITLDIVKALLKAARKEAAAARAARAAQAAQVAQAAHIGDGKGEGDTSDRNTAWTTHKEMSDLLLAAPSRADYVAILALGKALNNKLEEKINGKVASGSSEHVSYRDTTAAEDAAAIAKGLANKTKEATFLFDDSMTCEAWLRKGQSEMEDCNFEEAASSFYQAMVGADDGNMKEAQTALKVAVQAARSAKGLEALPTVSSSEGEDY